MSVLDPDIHFDFVSDLHIDHWDANHISQTPIGQMKHFPIDWPSIKQSNTLVIAGDISDDLETSINYLSHVAAIYSVVLFVDGNHDHIKHYPQLHLHQEIARRIAARGLTNVHYLPTADYRVGKTVFLGYCGWWDYNGSSHHTKTDQIEYFDKWISLEAIETHHFAVNVSARAAEEATLLSERLAALEADPSVHNIVVVSHTVPINELARDVATDVNSEFDSLAKLLPSKVTRWIFGHNHAKQSVTHRGVTFMSNPRGRPEDYDRETYTVSTVGKRAVAEREVEREV